MVEKRKPYAMSRRGVSVAAVAALALALFVPQVAAAQSYPNKTIRFVVPYPAGGLVDALARMLAGDRRIPERLRAEQEQKARIESFKKIWDIAPARTATPARATR